VAIGQRNAKKILEDLRSGVPCEEFVEEYSSKETTALRTLKEALDDVAAGELSIVRFIRGSYGSGKTHTLTRLKAYALKQDFLVSSVQISREHTFAMVERTLAKLIESLQVTKMGKREQRSGIVVAIERWARNVNLKHRPDQIDVLPTPQTFSDFRKALRALIMGIALEGHRHKDGHDLVDLAQSWFAADRLSAHERKALSVRANVDKSNARTVLNGLARLFKGMGYKGWLLVIDEQEAVSTLLAPRQRQYANSNLRMIIDSKSEVEGLMWIFASTPEFFEDPERGIGTYAALRDRINPESILDATALEENDLRDIGGKLVSIYATAYPTYAEKIRESVDLGLAMKYLQEQIPDPSAMPRFFVQVMVGALDSIRSGKATSFDTALRAAFGTVYDKWGSAKAKASKERV